MSSGRLLEPGGNVRSRWMAIRVETHDRTRGMWGLVNFQDPPLRRVLLYPAAVGTSVYHVSVYRISVYRVSWRIGQHTFRRRRPCSSQTVHHTFCRRSQAIQSRHNLLPTPTTPSASAEAEGFSVRRRMLTMPTCMASMQVQPENRGSQRNQTARANHPRACARTILVRDPLHMRRSSFATVLVRHRPRAQPSSHRLVVLHTISPGTVLRTRPSSHSTVPTHMHPSSVANRKTRRARRQLRCTPPRAPPRPRQDT